MHLRNAVEAELTYPEGGYPRYRTPKEDTRASVRLRTIEPSAARPDLHMEPMHAPTPAARCVKAGDY